MGDFTDALSKLSNKLNVTFGSPNKSNFFNNNTFYNQTQEQNNNQNPTTTTTTNNIKDNDKFLLLRPTITTVFNDDDDLIDRESPALFPTISTFSPSPVPPNQSPFFATSSESLFRGNSFYVSGSNSSGMHRQLPSPLDGLGHFLEKGLQLGDSSSIKTRSSSSRSRATSIVSDDAIVISAMNSTSTRSRTASRAAAEPPVILEGKCEDTMEEEEEEELVSQFTVQKQQQQSNPQLVEFTNVTANVTNFFVPTPLYSSTITTTTTAVIQQQHVSNDAAKHNLIQSTQTTVEIEDTQPTNEEEGM